MPYTHRGNPTGDNHRPTPKIAQMLQAYGMQHDTPFGAYGYWTGQQSSPNSLAMQQSAIDFYRGQRNSGQRLERTEAERKAQYIKQAIAWNRQNPQGAQDAMTAMAPKAVEALGNDPLGRY